MRTRFVEIDVLRALAIVAMIIFHLVFDLDLFDVIEIDMQQTFWQGLALFVQIIFIVTTGITLVIASERGLRPRIVHAAKIFAFGMIITLVTSLLFPERAVVFGILHFMGVAIVLALPLLRFSMWNALLGAAIILATPWLAPLIQIDASGQPLDYFPLAPWFGVFLIGVAIGGAWYAKRAPGNIPGRGSEIASSIARHSLAIYLLHQPILVALIQIAKRMS
ncbi:hypothetical protein COV82_00380 [Candidatus Peregrinibacteria bacterium CG11_big_fil_rev_8_21_14_0_20_46_8]|nr:MAG: hypothetical protein COV82_00380 [Candidatus Peregrinibacteria bacterium CG11_big_fil_rev_8_21_14_0_20_46_8]